MSNDQLTINTLRELNSRLALQIDELRKENTEVKAENTRLKQAIEENVMLKIRFEELEKKNKTDTAKLTAENAELKDRVTKLEQKQTQVITNDQDASSTNDILQSTACSELSVNTQTQAQSTISSEIRDESKGSLFPIEGQSDREKDNNPDHLPELEHNPTRPESLAESETPKSSLSQDTINDDSVEILEFVETIHKENISNEIRERIRKKKLQSQGSMQSTSSSSDIQNNELNPVIDTREHKTTQSESIPTDQAQNTEIKIPYNKKIEQDLRDDLSVFKANNDNRINNVFDVQIPEFSLEAIITGPTKVTAQNIADLFILAIKVRQKEILCWYCYYKAYEDRIDEIKHINKIDDQTARTLVYNEIKTLLPDITNVNLRQKTFRAKKIYILLTGVGVEKVRAITSSASAISSLTDNQIQDIINCFPKKSISIDVKYQEKIGVTNCNAHVTEPSSSKDVSNIEVRISTESSHTSNSEDMINEDVKSLSETEVSVSAKSISKEPETVNVFDKYNENDGEFSDEFSDDNDDGDYCGFSDEDEPGYYYDLSSGKKTYKNSDYLISAY
ncbi:hypothetical protein C2G38_1419175 [Gigaspora rosea]|uniref:Uncharacterized protein n=2 Tax=Gigasporaceae TaxID=36753 RepID=A0A397V6N3_9GLOM|nr:hypothetical protein C2G38_1419175 [Gigaspora rosea]